MENERIDAEVKSITFSDLFKLVKRFFWQCVIITLVVTVLSGVVALFLAKPEYTAESTVLIDYEYSDSQSSPANDRNALLYGLDLSGTISDFVKQKIVSDDVKSKNNELVDKSFSSGISVSAKEDSLVITIKYTTTTGSEQAVATVNEVVESLISKANTTDSEGKVKYSVLANKIKLVDEATGSKVSKKWPIYVAIGFVLGLVCSAVFLVIKHFSDDTIKTRNEIEELTGFRVIATIEYVADSSKE